MAVCLFVFAMAPAPASAAPVPAGVSIRNVATATYVPAGMSQQETASSNAVQATVLAVEALLLTQDQSVTRPPNAQVTLSHLLSNVGNVTSGYTLAWANNAGGCGPDQLDLSALRVVRDANNNGVVDAGDPVLLLGSAGALSLKPGETASLLVQGTLPAASGGTACLALTATTVLQSQTATNRDVITVSSAAVISLVKSASYPGVIVPGSTRIDFTVKGSNIGAQDAQPTGSAVPGPSAIRVNGVASSLVLVRDLIPEGTVYVAGTLQSTAAGAVRLYRLPGDAAFNYRTTDDAAAIEVAIGVPTALVRNGSIAMQFAVKAKADVTGDIRNNAQSYYNDSAVDTFAQSNTVVIPLSPARIGVAKAATVPRIERNADGSPDGTATVGFSLHVRNFGTTWLYGVQVNDLLEGTGATQFGSYTAAAVPGANQYTVVPGTLRVVGNQGAGTVTAVNTGFTGKAAARGLLAPGAVLPVGAEFTVQFDVRINFTGRTGTLLNAARAEASLTPGGAPQVFDDSVDGSNPDADGDGNPGNDTSPTPISAQGPSLSIVKTASQPRRVGDGVYEIDYGFKVTNTGNGPAPNLRVIDNLNCTFDMDRSDGRIASWQLTGPVRARNGVLSPSTGFTGRATCNRDTAASTDPYKLPTEVALSLVDGSRALAPGQSEELALTVRVTTKRGADSTRVTLDNKAWAAAFAQNTVNVSPANLLAAAVGSARAVLMDPMGTVYNAVTRLPVAGAVVRFTRQSCNAGPVTPILPGEIVGAETGLYTFNADGSVSMSTGADGTYQFPLQNPPVTGLCTYAIAVTPPAGSGYVAPSLLLPAKAGSFASCGQVVPNAVPPQGAEPTTYYFNVVTGFNADGSACDAANNHVPLDPGSLTGLVMRKDGSKRQVEFGDFLDYALTVTNKTGFPVSGLNVVDTLPPGLAYVSGSARLNGVVTDNPRGGAGPQLVWSYPALSLAIDQSVMVRYRVRVGVGAPVSGDVVNRALANSGALQSNLATFTVRVTGGVFSDEAFAFGKVYMDCKRDRTQEGADEPGVPGVRLYMEDGTSAVTDVEGKWSLYGLKPVTHVLRLDETTLPPQARIVLLDNRNANNAASRFVDLKKGELHKANFPLAGCDDPVVMDDVARRRKLIAVRPDADGEAAVRSRLDPQGAIIPVGDQRSLPASGEVSASGAIGATVASSQPLITLPTAPAGGAGSFVGGVGATGGLTGTLGAVQQAGTFSSPVGVPGGTSGLLPGGVGSGVGTLGAYGINARSSSLSPLAQPLLPQAAPGAIELEKMMPGLDNTPGFIGLKDRDTLASQTVNVRVKGPAGANLQLLVNDEKIDGRRVGKKATLPSATLSAWEYIGLVLKPGTNLLRLEVRDDFGVVRGAPVEITVVAPDKLGAIAVQVPEGARADLRTPVPVKVRLTDAAGVPVSARAQLTLEADRGRWIEEDLNPNEPGTQVFMDGGEAEFHLLPPGEPGDVRVRVSTSAFVREVRIALLPDLRPMIGVGILEGTLDFTKRGKLALGEMPAGAAFETELRSLSSDPKDTRASARAAFFFKGAVKGEYLLTASLDTDKNRKDRLFRDIRPDEFYPVYGDSSVRGFDAQSSQRLYVRIDKNRSFLMYGDFVTSSSADVRQLSQTSRTLTGLKHVYETDTVRATSYASRTSQTQQVEEFAARGISGLYYLGGGSGSAGDFVENSERVEILVRDRSQPNVVLQNVAATRFVDYTIEPLSRRILFTRPIASVDANLNPQSIRVTYEIDAGGPKYTVAGTDVQVKVADNLQLGLVLGTDQNPENRRKLGAITALARLGENTSAAAELVQTDSDLNGKGSAGRIELRHQDEKLGVALQAARTSNGFDNPGATFAAGRTEANARAEYKVDPTLQVRAEALYSKDNLSVGNTRGLTVSAQKKINDSLMGEVGLRYGSTSSPSASLFDYNQVSSYNGALGSTNVPSSVTALGGAANAAGALLDKQQDNLATIRGRLTAQVPSLPQAQVFVEGEQDLRSSGKQIAIGGNYAITDKTRIYGRYEFISTLGGIYDLNSQQSRNTGILGVESNYMEGGRVYNEYRLADSVDGPTAQNAIGIRNTFKLNERWRLTGGVEHVKAMGGPPATASVLGQGDSTAVVSGVEYTSERVKASAILESRWAEDSNTMLSSAGLGYKIDEDWSLLVRSVYSDSKGKGTNEGDRRTLSRQQAGVAYRPVGQDVWNALARYEHKSEAVRGAGTTLGTISGNAFGSDATQAGDYKADIVSVHVNVNPQPGTYITGRFAAKRATQDDGLLKSSYSAQLLQGRLTYDINKDWDIGVQAGLLRGSGGSLQRTAGFEVGYQVYKDLWLSGGYNFVGLKDRDLTAGEYTSKGAFVRLRFKFDETALGFASAGSATKPAAGEPTAVLAPARITLQAQALFETGQHALKPGAHDVLDEVVARVKSEHYDVVEIVGAATPDAADAAPELPRQRAEAVAAYLVAQGVSSARVKPERHADVPSPADRPVPQGGARKQPLEIEVAG